MGSPENSRIGQYIVEDTLSSGRFGSVYLAYHKESGQRVAIKLIDFSNEDAACNARREIETLTEFRHPHVVSFVESFPVAPTADSQPMLAIVLEYADRGELYELIVSRGRLSEDLTRHIFRQLVEVVYELHKRGRIHRDIKPENVLLDRYLNVKLADFGLATRYDQSGLTMLTEYCGSLEYAAPEILQNCPYYGPEVDVYSLGVVLYAMLCGCHPFGTIDNTTELLRSIQACSFSMPDKLSPDAVYLLHRMLAFDGKERPTLDEVLSDPWMCPPSSDTAASRSCVTKAFITKRFSWAGLFSTPKLGRSQPLAKQQLQASSPCVA